MRATPLRRRRLSEIDYSFSIIPLFHFSHFPALPVAISSRLTILLYLHCGWRSCPYPLPLPLLPATRVVCPAFSARTGTFFFCRRKLIGFSSRVEHIFYWSLTAVIYCVSKGGERYLVESAFLQKGRFFF